MNEDWGVFSRESGERPALVSLDFELLPAAPLVHYPILATVRIALHNPGPDGLPSPAESDEIGPLENAIQDALKLEGAKLVALVWVDGFRKLYFYAPPGCQVKRWVEAACEGSGYQVSASVRPDPQWLYFVDELSPSAWELQVLSNNQVIATMLENGDDVESPRDVDHYLYFPTDEHRSQAIAAAKTQGFEVSELLEDEPPPNPFGVQLTRRDSISPASITEPVELLFRLAEQHNGDYDGWGSPVVVR